MKKQNFSKNLLSFINSVLLLFSILAVLSNRALAQPSGTGPSLTAGPYQFASFLPAPGSPIVDGPGQCGLDYCMTSVALNTRVNPTVGTVAGQPLPPTFTVTCLPAGAIVRQAYLYFVCIGTALPGVITVTDPQGAQFNFPYLVTAAGTGTTLLQPAPEAATCWPLPILNRMTTGYGAVITAAITGPGPYTINGLPAGPNIDIDGATILIVYDLPCSANGRKGSLYLSEGLSVISGGMASNLNINYASYSPNTGAEGFYAIGDVEAGPGPSQTTCTFGTNPAMINPDVFWQDVSGPNNVTGTGTAFVHRSWGGDCSALPFFGVYFQDGSTTCPAISVNIATGPAPCAGGCMSLTAIVSNGIPPFTYSWSPSTGLSCTNCANPVACVTAPTNYTVTVTDLSGCTATATVNVTPCTNSGTGTWPKQGEGNRSVKVHSILADKFGSVYMTGYFYDVTKFTGFPSLTPATAIDMFVLKYDACGMDWIQQFGDNDPATGMSTDNTGLDLAIASDGSLIVTGKYDRFIQLGSGGPTLNSGLLNQGFVAKLDPCNGDVLAAHGPVSTEGAFASVAASPSGNIYVAGKQLTGPGSLLVKKFDNNLNLIGATTAFINAVDNDDQIFGLDDNITRGIALDNQDNVYVAVNLNAPSFSGSGFINGASIAKFDNNLIQITGIQLSTFDKIRDLATDGTDIFGVGRTNPPSSSPSLIVVKTPVSLASAATGTFNGKMGTSIDVDGTYFYFTGMDNGANMLAGKVDKTSVTATPAYESGYSATAIGCNTISHDASGNAYFAGGFEGFLNLGFANITSTNTTPRWDMFGARLNTAGNAFREGAQNPEEKNPADILFYPNPGTGIFHLKLSDLTIDQEVSVEIFAGQGMLLQKRNLGLVKNRISKIDMSGLPSGIYVLKIASGEEIFYRKISLVK